MMQIELNIKNIRCDLHTGYGNETRQNNSFFQVCGHYRGQLCFCPNYQHLPN